MIKQLLSQNLAWAQAKARADNEFFAKIAAGQKPPVFWIGCCDSRVIPAEIFGTSLGDMFVHTNIANQVNADDANTMSALAYAVEALRVEDVVVCGHTHCGGVAGAISDGGGVPEATWRWLQPLRQLYHANEAKLPPNDADNKARLERRVCELNVRHQVDTAAGLAVIRAAWESGERPTIHGWLFNLDSGVVEEVCRRSGA